MTLQDLIFKLQTYWAAQGCLIQQPMDIEMGAGTMNPETKEIILGSLKSEHVDMFLPFRGDHALRVPQVPYIEGWLTALEEKQKRASA